MIAYEIPQERWAYKLALQVVRNAQQAYCNGSIKVESAAS